MSSRLKYLNNIRFPAWTAPAALFGLAIIAYAPLIAWLGFYWDDWPYLWIYHSFGPGGYIDYVASDRPYSAWIFMLTSWLFGEAPLPYHLLALALRFLAAVIFWWVLGLVWPGKVRQATWAAMLLVVYPGFKQHPIALIYNHHYSVLVLFLFSLLAMLWAERRRSLFLPLTLLSLAAAAGMFSLEYYVGLELLRPLLLWITMGDFTTDRRQRWQRTLRSWAPYLALLVVYIFWRVFVFQFPSYQPEGAIELIENPLRGSAELVEIVLADLVDVLVEAWGAGLRAPSSLAATLGIALAVGLGTAVAAIYLLNLDPEWKMAFPVRLRRLRSDHEWALEALALGVLALVLGGFPAWFTDLPIHLNFPYDRLVLPLMPGVCLIVAALIELLIRPRIPQVILLSTLVAMSLALHLQNANTYRHDLEDMQNLFWQLTWRAPGLQPGTTVLTHQEPLLYFSDNSLTAPLNYVYAPDYPAGWPEGLMPYVFYNVEVRLGRGLPALEPGLPVEQGYRSLEFSGNTSDILVIYWDPPACLRVIDPEIDGFLPGMSAQLAAAVPLSDISQVQVEPAVPALMPEHLFGPEPAGTWCYYFQKAGLASQMGDWQRVAALGEQAFALEEEPRAASEYLVFIEGYAQTRQWEKARRLSETLNGEQDLRPQACDLWNRAAGSMQLSPEEQTVITEEKALLDCE